MQDRKGIDICEGDMVKVRIFDDTEQTSSEELAFVEEIRFGTHVVLKVRNGRKEPYVFNSRVVEKIPRDKAMLFLLEQS